MVFGHSFCMVEFLGKELIVFMCEEVCMVRVLALIFLFTFPLFLTSCVVFVEVQTEVYVSPNGDDANFGRKSAPVKTLDRAIEIAKEKGIKLILIEEGTWLYTSTADIFVPEGMEVKGGYDSSFSSQVGYSTLDNVRLELSSGVKLSRIAVRNVSIRGIKISSSKDVTLYECKVYNVTNSQTSSGYVIQGVGIVILNSQNIRVQRCEIYNCHGRNINTADVYGAGIGIVNSTKVEIWENTISNCSVWANGGGGGGIAVKGGSGIDIYANTFKRCGGDGVADLDSVILFYSTSPTDLTIEGNIIGGKYKEYTYGIYEAVEVSGHKVIANTFLSSGMKYPYYDNINGSLTINSLNNGEAGTSEARDNLWQ